MCVCMCALCRLEGAIFSTLDEDEWRAKVSQRLLALFALACLLHGVFCLFYFMLFYFIFLFS